MALTLTGVLWEPTVTLPKADLIRRSLETVQAVAAHTAYEPEQIFLEGETRQQEFNALPVDEVNLSDLFDTSSVIDMHIVVPNGDEVDVIATIEIDLDDEVPQLVFGGEPEILDASGLIVALVKIWDAFLGFHTDDAVMDVAADCPMPIGKYVWLAPGYDGVLAQSEVAVGTETAEGVMYELPGELGSEELLDAATQVVAEFGEHHH